MAIPQKTGLFIVAFDIGGGKPGAPLFHLNLSVYTPGETLTGAGSISQATNPPLDLHSKVEGKYTTLLLEGTPYEVLASLTGYPIINWPPNAGIGPVILPNVELFMVLHGDWKSGVANYRYRTDLAGEWHVVKNAIVKAVSPHTL